MCLPYIYIDWQTSPRSFFCIALADFGFPPTASLILPDSSVSRSPNFFPPIASLFLPFFAHRISFPSLTGACSQVTTDRHMHQDILAKFAKCRCFDFRYIIFGLLKGYLWKMEQFFLLWSFRIMVMWQKRQLAVAFYLHSFPDRATFVFHFDVFQSGYTSCYNARKYIYCMSLDFEHVLRREATRLFFLLSQLKFVQRIRYNLDF